MLDSIGDQEGVMDLWIGHSFIGLLYNVDRGETLKG
jgi:hypothetical protein